MNSDRLKKERKQLFNQLSDMTRSVRNETDEAVRRQIIQEIWRLDMEIERLEMNDRL